MILFKNQRYTIEYDSTIYVTSATTPNSEPIKIYAYMEPDGTNVNVDALTIEPRWTNIHSNVYCVNGWVIKKTDGTSSILTGAKDIYIADNYDTDSGEISFDNNCSSTYRDVGFVIFFLYSNAEPERMDKQPYLNVEKMSTGTLRESSSVVNPSITFEWNPTEMPLFNYVYIPNMGRFYFVTNIIFIANNIWMMNLSSDGLMSYKDEILTNTAEIERQENDYNEDLIDDERIVENGYDFTIVESAIDPDTIFNITTDDAHYPNFGIVLGVYN